MYMTYVKAYKKKFNAVKDFEKTPQLRVRVNSVFTKRVEFSLLESGIDVGAIMNNIYKYVKLATCDNDEEKDLKSLK